MTTEVTEPKAPPSQQELLAKRIAKAEQELLTKRNSDDPYEEDTAVLFTGNHHDAIPRHLIMNENLSANEKITWQVLRAGTTDPTRPGSIARRSDLARAVNCSGPTVTTNKTMLRIQRWMTFCKQVKRRGQFVGDIYLLHDEPLSIMSTLEIDPTYIGFLELHQQSKNKRMRSMANRILEEIAIQLSDRPTTELDVLVSRLQQFHQSKNFALVEHSIEFTQEVENLIALSEYEGLQEGNSDHSKNFAMDEIDRSKIFAPVKKISYISSSLRSSSSTNKNISTHAREEMSPERLASINTFRELEDAVSSFEKRYSYSDLDQQLAQFFPELCNRHLMPYVIGVLNITNISLVAVKFKGMDPTEKLMIMLQILGRHAAYKHGWTDRINNVVSYSAALISAQMSGRFQPDDWAMKLLAAMKMDASPDFKDSPDLQARSRLSGIGGAVTDRTLG